MTGGIGLTYGQNPNGRFDINQSDLQSVSGFNLGNPNLREEKSDSYTIGAILNPRSIDALRNLVVRVDYYNISIKDAIIGIDRAYILDQCFNEGNQDLCQFVRRRAQASAVNSAGTLEFIDQAQINGGKLKSAGIDVTVSYKFPLGNTLPGALNLSAAYSRLLTGYTIPLPGADKDPFKGEIETPKNRFTGTIGYMGDKLDLSFTGTYIGKAYDDDQFLAQFDLEPESLGVGAEFYLDTQARFKASDQYEFYVGVDNLLDNKAPNLLSGTSFNVTGTDTAADVYDVFGRRFYAGARLRF